MSRAHTVQMIGAEILKLRRRRGAMLAALVLSVGIVALYLAVKQARNSGGFGGEEALLSCTTLLGMYFGSFAAILIGTEAGTADVTSGVFRDLAATGRSRAALFLVRIPGAVAVASAFIFGGFAVAVAGAVVFKGTAAAPDAGLVVRCGAWLALCTAVVTTLTTGIASLTSSRALTLIAVIGWQTIATTLLYSSEFLGSLRDGMLLVALSRLRPGPDTGTKDLAGSTNALPGFELPMGAAAAVLIVAAWFVVPVVLGAWRTRRLDG